MINWFMVIGEPDSFSFESVSSEFTCFPSEFLERFLRMNCLWSIYTQETNTRLYTSYYRIYCISIDNLGNQGLFWSSIQHLSAQNIVRRNCEIPSKQINLHSSTGKDKCVTGISERDTGDSLTQSEDFSWSKSSAQIIRAAIIADFTCTEGESF